MATSSRPSSKGTPSKGYMMKKLTGGQQRIQVLNVINNCELGGLRELLKGSSFDVNMRFRLGMTPIMRAVEKGSTECVNLLIKCGADVNLKNFNQKTPLMYAVQSGNVECITSLLEAGADVNAKDIFGETVLFQAILCDNEECVKLLCESGADVNTASNAENTPLMFAVIYGRIAYIKFLASLGADISKQNADEQSAVMLAVTKRKLLRIGKSKTKTYSKKMQPNLECVKVLLELGAGVNDLDRYGQTPLFCACLSGNLECFKLLLKGNADVTLCDGEKIDFPWRYLWWEVREISVLAKFEKFLYAAGKPVSFHNESDLLEDHSRLQYLCKGEIRKHLASCNPKGNLYFAIDQLPLANVLKSYLLYYMF